MRLRVCRIIFKTHTHNSNYFLGLGLGFDFTGSKYCSGVMAVGDSTSSTSAMFSSESENSSWSGDLIPLLPVVTTPAARDVGAGGGSMGGLKPPGLASGFSHLRSSMTIEACPMLG